MAGFDSRCRDGAKFRATNRTNPILSLDFGRCHFFSSSFAKPSKKMRRRANLSLLLFLSVLCKDVHGDKRFEQAREFVEKLGIPEKVKSEIPERAKSIAKNIEVPKDSWAVRGYESFHGKRPVTTPKTARGAATPTKATEPLDDEEGPSAATRAFYGVSAATVAGALGASVLAEISASTPGGGTLVDAFKKEVTFRPMVVKDPKKAKVELAGATIPSEVFNLVKGIVGVGVLSLPAGVAAFGSAPSAFIPAAILITIIGVLSAYGFALIGKVCAYTGAKSYRDAWSKTVGEGSSWIPAWSTTCKTFLACLAFSMVLADTFSSLLEASRDETLVGVTLVILAPLCLMKNLKSLAPFSLLGVLGMTYTAVAMTIRWLDGSYLIDGEIEGNLVAQVARHLKPKFGDLGMESVMSPNALILVCMLSTAYMAHFNAPKFYLELRDNTVKRFNSVVSWSFGISIFLMGFITMVGFLTFGKACDGLVLNNYATDDVLMGFSRIAVALSLVFSYPLAFTGCRDGFMDLAKVPVEKRSNGLMNFVTILLLSFITYLATILTDVSFVLAFGGATLGNALTYLYPALMYRAVVKQQNLKGEGFGVFVAMLSALLGVVMGIIGAGMALKSLS